MAKYEKSLKKERYETQEEKERHRLELEEEAARPTGFDVLLANKEKGLADVRRLLKDEPTLTRKQLSMRTKLSMRTIYRYLRIIREGQQITTTVVDILIADKEKRKKKLVRLMKEHPEYPRSQLASKLGISRKTLYSYFDELGL